MSAAPPDRAAVVIIGGGVLGCSIAWHLARAGQRDVLVIDRGDLGSGATARSAGLVARGRLHEPTLRMVHRTREAIAELESALGVSVGFHRVGSVRVATSNERVADLERMDGLLAQAGIAVSQIDASEAGERVPWLDAATARRISYVEDDGYVDAYQLAGSYAAAARALGVRFRTRTPVNAIRCERGWVVGVEVAGNVVAAEAVVDAAGAWAMGVAADAGYPLGAAPVRSHYFITAPQPGWPCEHPITYLPDARAYARPEVGGLLLGIQEPQSRTFDGRSLPADIGELPLSSEADEWSVLEASADTLRPYIPGLEALPLAHHITGLSTYTPDGRFLLGRAGETEGLYVAAGCCGTGVSASGGIGASLASLVLGEPSAIDLADFAPGRFGPIDPFSEEFRARCAAARADKLRRG